MLLLQKYLQIHGILENFRLLDYNTMNLFLFAFLFGVGAATGDLIKSFFKRRFGKPAGSVWFPFDQLDLVFGSLVFLSPFYILEWEYIAVVLVATPFLHFMTNVVGYEIGLKRVWW